MGRDFHITGQAMVYVKGRSDIAIASLTQLGLSDGDITISIEDRYDNMYVDAWGGPPGKGGAPADVQIFNGFADIHVTLVHYDRSVLQLCMQESAGGVPGTDGALIQAGARLGNGVPRFAPSGTVSTGGLVTTGNHYIGLNIASPIDSLPWRFYYTFLFATPLVYPVGATRTIVQTHWRAIPYTTDPWGVATTINGVSYGGPGDGAYGSLLFDHTLDQ